MAESALAVLAALVASLGAFLFGLDIGYIAPILECASFKRDVAHLGDWDSPYSQVESTTAGLIVGIFSLGCVISASPAVSGHFLDRWGRRGSIIVGTVVFLAGCVLQALAMSIAAMLTGRLVTGLSIGLLSTVVPLYQAEMAPANLRGAFTCTYNVAVTAGIFVAALADLGLVGQDGGWRLVIWLQTLPALLILALMPLLPRSPRWLVQQGRSEEALAVLESIRSAGEASQELDEIVAECSEALRLGESRLSQVFTGRLGQTVALGVTLQMLQNLVGINSFMYFGPKIFAAMGLSANLCQTVMNGVNLAFTFPALYLADSAGRRSLLICGAAGMALTSAAMGALGALFMTQRPDQSGWVAPPDGVAGVMAALIFVFVAFFACTWGPVVWMYCAEIFPLKHRSQCVGLTTMANWVGNYLVAQFTPMLLDSIGFLTFFILTLFSLLGLMLALRLPETKGLMLEHISQRFEEVLGTASYGSVDLGKPPKA